MLWTLFKLQCVYIRPPRSHHRHSFVPPWHQGPYPNMVETKLTRLQPGYSFLHFSVFCKLPASQELHKGSKETDITGHYIKTVQRMDHVLPNCPNQSQVLLAEWGPVILISLDSLTTTWLKSDLRQTPTWSKLSPPGYRHWTTVFKQNQQDATLYNGIYYYKCSTCFRQFLCPSSGALKCVHSITHLSCFFCFLPLSWVTSNSPTVAVRSRKTR